MYSRMKPTKEILAGHLDTTPQLLCYCEKCELLATRVHDGKKVHVCARCKSDMKYVSLPIFRVLSITRSIHGPYHNDTWTISDAYNEPEHLGKKRRPYQHFRPHPLDAPLMEK